MKTPTLLSASEAIRVSDSRILDRGPDEVIELSGTLTDRLVVGTVLVRRLGNDRELLLLRRVSDDDYGGIEELPSGRVEDSETVAKALEREIAEETGLENLKIGSFEFAFVYPSKRGPTLQLNYWVECAEEATVEIDLMEHSSWRWMRIDRLDQSDLTSVVKDGLMLVRWFR